MKFFTDYLNSGTVKQQNKKRFAALLVGLTAILLAIALVVLIVASIATAIADKAPKDDDGDDTGTKIPQGYTTTTLEAAQLTSGDLLLIDDTHPFAGTTPTTVLFDGHETRPKTDAGTIIYSIGGRFDLSATDETVRAFNKMISDFYADEKNGKDDNLYISAAYNINSANQAGEMFKLGTVIGLKYYVNYNEDATNIQSIYNVEKYKWIYDNAAKYGFVRASALEGEEHIFRYVGVAHATYMDNNDKTLAEYLEILKSRSASKPLSVTVDNASYNMYYSATAEAVVPTKYSYTVSGDNMNGYIITVDKTSATSAQ